MNDRFYMNGCIDWTVDLVDQKGAALDASEFTAVEMRFALGGPGSFRTVHVETPTVVEGALTLHTEPGFLTVPGRWTLHVWVNNGSHWTPAREWAFLAMQGVEALAE